ncbi:putative DNA (cytosine-5-)-methyltransferase, protein kinase RLK-Pelle-DLSV family [Helianthus annuus]|nr:putative DNA (cytosine-5-)-methyltransferase, protein kinase RLK-Pelle-DLSV family [Helianthus annuus]
MLSNYYYYYFFVSTELNGLELNTCTFTLRQIKTATNIFDVANKIGEGGFGSVYKGILPDGTLIAVKQLSSRSKQGNREFLNELGMISALQHPHLVKLHGCCIEGNQLLLAYEYMENNSLACALYGGGMLAHCDWLHVACQMYLPHLSSAVSGDHRALHGACRLATRHCPFVLVVPCTIDHPRDWLWQRLAHADWLQAAATCTVLTFWIEGPKEWQLELNLPTRYRICLQIAKGLAFLHEESRLKIVHRDIKTTNVLLDKNLNAKISDFGLAKLDEDDNTHISTGIAGT